MSEFKNLKTLLLGTLACGILAGCTASPPEGHAGRDQLIKSIEPELRLIGVPTDGLDTYRTIRLGQLKAIVDERPPENFARRLRAMLIIDKARSEPGFSE